MEDWSVPGSGSEGEGSEAGDGRTPLDFGGIKIPPMRLLELMQTVQQRRTVELDSLSLSEKKRHKRKKKRKRKRMGGAKGVEDTSETASEIRSTTCTSTTECRDARRPKFDTMFDNPELDDNDSLLAIATSSRTARIKKPPPLANKKAVQLASLDRITWQKREEETRGPDASVLANSCSQHAGGGGVSDEGGGYLNSGGVGGGEPMDGEGGGGGGVARIAAAVVGEEDGNEDTSDSESDMKVSLISQINKVEQLLDFEVS